MSAFVLDKADIDILTRATDAALRLNQKYSGSYPLHPETVALLGRYAGDLHSNIPGTVYREYKGRKRALWRRYKDFAEIYAAAVVGY